MPSQTNNTSPSGSLLEGAKILVVDDERDAVGLAKLVLEDDGADISCAYDGEELWSGLEDGRWGFPDLILLDIKMPRMNGFEVCRKLKQDSRYQHIPILVFPGKVSEKDRQEAHAAGADGYITKPFVAKDLSPMIKSMIDSVK